MSFAGAQKLVAAGSILAGTENYDIVTVAAAAAVDEERTMIPSSGCSLFTSREGTYSCPEPSVNICSVPAEASKSQHLLAGSI